MRECKRDRKRYSERDSKRDSMRDSKRGSRRDLKKDSKRDSERDLRKLRDCLEINFNKTSSVFISKSLIQNVKIFSNKNYVKQKI